MPSLKLENITKRFDDTIALDNISLEIRDEEFFVLLGQTGAGKTTTLRCIAGLETPDAGAIYLNEERIDGLTPAERDVAVVFQSHVLYPHLTVYENMAFPLHPRRLPEAEVHQRVSEIAAMLHIEHLLERLPSQLSGGETQRVGLGRAMVRHPRVFLMDEPISNLDAKLRTEMRAELRWRQRQAKTTTIYVTHDQVEAMSMADRVAVMEKGRIQQLGTPTEVYDRPANLFVASFIGNPGMNLIPCKPVQSGSTVQLQLVNVHRLSLTEKMAKLLTASSHGEALVLGAHPEDLYLHVSEMPDALPVEVYSFEPLGAETIVEVLLGQNEAGQPVILKSRVEPTLEVDIGVRRWLRFAPERLRLFDANSGQALLEKQP